MPVPPSLVRTPYLVTRSRDPEEAEEECSTGQERAREKKGPVRGPTGQGSSGREGEASEEQPGVPNAAHVPAALACQIPHTCFCVPGQGAVKIDDHRPTSPQLVGTLLNATLLSGQGQRPFWSSISSSGRWG